MKKVRESKNHKAFGMYLSRNKFDSAHAVASLLIDKFATAKKPSDWQIITVEDLKERNILPSKKHNTFSHWRDEMVKNKILICMATKQELLESKPTHKGSMFKFSDRIQKYIDKAIYEFLPFKIEGLDLKVDGLNDKYYLLEKTKADNERVDRLESEVKVLKENVNNLTSIVLEAFPPDTPARRKIVQDNINNKDECIKLLAKEIEKNIQETGKMFN